MIYFGTCVGYPDKLRDIAIPGIVQSMMGETYNHLTKASNGYNIFPIYEHLMRSACAQKAEALVLMHDDLEFRDPELAAKIRRIFKDPSIAIIGCVGARGVTSLDWWDGERKGYAEDAASGVYSYGFDGGETCEVDSVDGMFLVLSPWAIENLTIEGLGYEGLHGYAEELCFQARGKGKRVVVAPISAFHHTKGGITGAREGWEASQAVFARRWPPAPKSDPWADLDLADIEAVYTKNRGRPPSCTPHVMLATMAYNPPCLEFLNSRDAVGRDLVSNGVSATVLMTAGDSLVMRGRHAVMHDFLKSDCSHLLFWDVDIVPLDPTCVRRMLATGHDLIGGACPFRGETGAVVCNITQEDRERKLIDTDNTSCTRVSEVGTGFMLISRAAIVALCEAHPELYYKADMREQHGEPMWALFDTQIRDQRFLSEDYFFCALWKDLGEHVYVYVPFEAQHWGRKGFTASFMKALAMRSE